MTIDKDMLGQFFQFLRERNQTWISKGNGCPICGYGADEMLVLDLEDDLNHDQLMKEIDVFTETFKENK